MTDERENQILAEFVGGPADGNHWPRCPGADFEKEVQWGLVGGKTPSRIARYILVTSRQGVVFLQRCYFVYRFVGWK